MNVGRQAMTVISPRDQTNLMPVEQQFLGVISRTVGIMFFANTSRYPTERVAQLVAFAMAGLDVTGVAVNVKNCSRTYAGRAYHPVPRISSWYGHPGVANLIVLRVGTPASFPCDNLTTTIRKQALTDWLPVGATFPAGADIRYERAGHGRREKWRAVRVTVIRHPYGGKASPLIEMRNWQECLVALAAHEGQHIAQFRAHTRRSEVECERFAAARLMAYRDALVGEPDSAPAATLDSSEGALSSATDAGTVPATGYADGHAE